VQLLNFKVGSLPFNYLGVPIFKGRPKACYLQPIADKIKKQTLGMESFTSIHCWKSSAGEICYSEHDDL
jgi:hypothetical protein